MFSWKTKCYHEELMLSYGTNIIIWGKCYHVEDFIIMWEEMLSCETNILMASKYSIIM